MVALQESLALKNIVSQFLEKRHTDYRHLTTIDQNSLSHMFSKLPTRHLTWRQASQTESVISKLPTRHLTCAIAFASFSIFSKLPTRHLTVSASISNLYTFSKLPTRHLTRTFLFIFLYCKRIFANFYDFDPFFGLILILLIINKLKTVLKKGAINLKIRDGCCFA